MSRSVAVLSAGSNVGDTRAHLTSVADALGDRLLAVSDVYLTAPWGGVEQDDFANVTLLAKSGSDTGDGDTGERGTGEWAPADWLRFCHDCEERAERVREVRWGPRTLDVDVISLTRDGVPVIADDPALTLPHPRAWQRAFVLVPWLELDPDAVLVTADGPRRVAELVALLDPAEVAGVRRSGPLEVPARAAGDRR